MATLDGFYTLVSATLCDSKNATELGPLIGPNATGSLMYHDGYMSALLTPSPPDETRQLAYSPGTLVIKDEETKAWATLASRTLAYSGPFTVNESAKTIYHDIKFSLLPAMVGQTQVRSYKFNDSGSELTLSAALSEKVTLNVVWNRSG